MVENPTTFLGNHIFISYAHADAEPFAERLHDELEAQGINAWLDKRDIRDGFDWDAEIDRGLKSARAVVAVLTPASILSLQAKSEWNDALNRHLPVIGLLLKTCEIPRVLRMLNYIDFRPSFDSGLAQLYKRLNRLENDHLAYLKELLTGYVTAQSQDDMPDRFAYQIQELRNVVESWDKRSQAQAEQQTEHEERVLEGMKFEQERISLEAIERKNSKHRKVVGQRISDIVNFKDRYQEREQILTLLAMPSTRVVSIISRGGMGKTALATSILVDLEKNRLPQGATGLTIDGIIYLSTRTSGVSLERIFLHFAELLNDENESVINVLWTNPRLSVQSKVNGLLEILAEGFYVLLLDNMEDLLDDDGNLKDSNLQIFFNSILISEHAIKLLVTSRIPLAFRSGVIQHNKEVPLLEGLPEKEGVEMLRGLDPNGESGLRDAPYETLKGVVALVKGVPRALEVIASILANNPFISIDELMEQDMIFQQPEFVEALVRENYKHLDNESRLILEALAVYGRPVPEVALDFILEPFAKGIPTRTLLKRMVQTHTVSIDRYTRFIYLHPIDRDYIYRQIAEGMSIFPTPSSREELHRRAAEYYRQLAVSIEAQRSFEDLSPQLSQFEHHLEAKDFDSGANVLIEIEINLRRWGYNQRIEQMAERLVGKLVNTQLAAKNLCILGFSYFNLSLFPQAISAFLESNKLVVELDNAPSNETIKGDSLLGLGVAHRNIGQLGKAINYIESSLLIARTLQDKKKEASRLDTLGDTVSRVGDFRRALGYLEESLSIARSLDDKMREHTTLSHIGSVYIDLGSYQDAIDTLELAKLIARTTEMARAEVFTLAELGEAYLMSGNRGEIVLETLLTSLKICERFQSPTDEIYTRMILTKYYLFRAELQSALVTISPTEHFIPIWNNHRALTLKGLVHARLNQFSEAQDTLRLAVRHLENLTQAGSDPLRVFRARYYHALCLSCMALVSSDKEQEGYLNQARENYRAGFELSAEKGVVQEAVLLLKELLILDHNNALSPLYSMVVNQIQ